MPENSATKTVNETSEEAFVSNTSISRAVSRAVKAGKLRKLASRLYTRNMTEPPEFIVRRNIYEIVSGYFPGAIIADRMALENKPATDGSVCLISETGQNVKLPGHVLRPRRGAGPLPSDRPFLKTLYLSSPARAFLDNMSPSRARKGLVSRTLTREEIEERLDKIIRLSSEKDVRRLRDDIRKVGKELGKENEAKELDNMIGSMLGIRQGKLSAPAAIARQKGRPYDPNRKPLFQSLHATLRNHPPRTHVAKKRGLEGNGTLAFYEAYFSNFIEGTEFAVEEASDIVFHGNIPSERPNDAHDILGTWNIVSDSNEMKRTPKSNDDLIQLLKARHATMMESRTDINPGAFKLKNNQAGGTVFVEPDLVIGTLEQGFAFFRSLEIPFQRAVFMMFLVTEVHPFTDGNGRIARVMMNAELEAAREERIVIPTIYRDNYLSALNALSQNNRTEPLVRMLEYAQRWTAAIDWRSVKDTRRELDDCNAFLNTSAAETQGKRLEMPSGAARWI